jgi:3-deoxy-D-manno-octulosonate 8-phosphate phosphatase (KDO 8-P phosphatase)
MKVPKVVITDIDGVWTDGGMYYDNFNNEFKKFSTSDGWGVAMCKAFGIEIVVITGESNNIVTRRCEKLKVQNVFLGAANKLEIITQFLSEKSIDFDDVAFIGDDINDIELMRKVAIKGTPSNGIEYLKTMCDIITIRKGGEGAFREFVERILLGTYSYDEIVEQIYKPKEQ